MIGGALRCCCLPLLSLPPALYCCLHALCLLSLSICPILLTPVKRLSCSYFILYHRLELSFTVGMLLLFWDFSMNERIVSPMLSFKSVALSRIWHSLLGLLQMFPQQVRGWITSRSSENWEMSYCISTTPPSFLPLRSKCTGQWVIVAAVIFDLSFNKQMTLEDHYLKKYMYI